MEKADALKAGHCVEPVRGMQLCVAAAGIINATAVRRAVEASDAISFALSVAPRDLKINEGFQNAQWFSGRRRRRQRRGESASLSKLLAASLVLPGGKINSVG